MLRTVVSMAVSSGAGAALASSAWSVTAETREPDGKSEQKVGDHQRFRRLVIRSSLWGEHLGACDVAVARGS